MPVLRLLSTTVRAVFCTFLEARSWWIEAWARNAFDEDYIQMAIPYSLAASGFIGEPGAPQTMGISVGFRF